MLTKADLILDLHGACKPSSAFRIGAEHEVFLFQNGQRLDYTGIRSLFEYFINHGWASVYEGDNIIALTNPATGASLTIEPGGQFELSGAIHTDMHALADEHYAYWDLLDDYAAAHNIEVVYKGFDDRSHQAPIPWMPKERYAIMRGYMPSKGTLGHMMMQRTCTVQANVDFSSQVDMIQKLRVAMATQPLITALFANSPYTYKGKTFKSFRGFIWQHTDPDRTGLLPFVFEEGFGFERYVDYALTVPMYFVRRGKAYMPAAGGSFTDFMAGCLKGFEGQTATLDDWHDHLTVAFPEVRLKHYLEMRGADCKEHPFILALPALWVGLLYDDVTLDQLSQMVQTWPFEAIRALHKDAPRHGLDTTFLGQSARTWAAQLVDLAKQGLERRAMCHPLHHQRTEAHYLAPLL
jgi:glutamate--cysteine ligase